MHVPYTGKGTLHVFFFAVYRSNIVPKKSSFLSGKCSLQKVLRKTPHFLLSVMSLLYCIKSTICSDIQHKLQI